jgi:hypothetical protein
MIELKIESALTPATFSPIILGEELQPQIMAGKLGSGRPVILTFQAFEVRKDILPQLLAIEARRISGGQPRKNLSNFQDAIAEFGAQLITLTLQEGSSISETGIISVSEMNVGSGGFRNTTTSIAFYPCQRLRYYGLTEFQSV